MKREIKLHTYIFVVTFLAILITFAVVLYQVNDFNSQERKAKVGNGVTDNALVKASTVLRGGKSGKWLREIKTDMEKDSKGNLTGEIYDITLTNDNDHAINPWTLRIDINTECFINNSWCGTVELHQGVASGAEKVQSFDLRYARAEDITLDFYKDAADLFIPLHKGDYIIYYPSEDADEAHIETRHKDKNAAITIGLIFYYNPEKTTVESIFDTMDMTYYFKDVLIYLPQFNLTVLALILWIVGLLIVVVSDYKTSEFHKKEDADKKLINDLLYSTAAAVDRHSGRPDHSLRVANITWLIARRMGYVEEDCIDYYYGAMMHDLGKLMIPEQILLKKNRTEEEEEAYRRHVTLGVENTQPITTIRSLKDVILYHHERYDGMGYPMGLAGDEIPIPARIVTVADAVDNICYERGFIDELPVHDLVDVLDMNKGSLFDPDVASALIEILYDTDGRINLGRRVDR